MKQPRMNLLSSATLLLLLLLQSSIAQDERSIQITNQSSGRVEVHWVHPDTGEMFLQSDPDILHGTTFALNSYIGHMFEIRELPAKKTGVCAGDGQTCRVDHFTVNWNQDQLIVVKEGVEVELTNSKDLATSALLEDCKSAAESQLSSNPDGVDIDDALEDLAGCVQTGIAAEIERANEEIAFQAAVRARMGAAIENYTCADEGVDTTGALRTEYWDDGGGGPRGMEVRVMIDRPASKVHAIDDFLTEDECQAVEAAAAEDLDDATVADGNGGSRLSESRKAMQAGIEVDWDGESEGDPIARLSRRVYDYVNHVLPFDIKENGQEDLMSIQYEGRGLQDKAPDRYMPHCDGDCNGLDFKPGNRMATIVMYCEVPKVGGATRFANSNIHIRPKKYAATFFSYIDPESMKMDNGFTEHSGCPVLEGEKKIVTQWVRLGVDDENPWDSFNTLGIKYSDEANQ